MAEVDEVVDQIVSSLNERPEDWSFNRYAATHCSGLRVWIANKHYGLSIDVPKSGAYDFREFGGVTGWSVFAGPLIPWRKKLLAACRREQKRREGPPVLVVASQLLSAA